MKKNLLISFLILSLFLGGCGTTYKTEEILLGGLSRSPKLKVEMQKDIGGDGKEIRYKEKDGKTEGDSLVISINDNEGLSLPSYVQTAINELKVKGYTLEKEKGKKGEIAGKKAISKNYKIKNKEKQELYIGELFVEYSPSEILILSYASKKEDNTKKFINETSSIKLNF